MADTDWNAFPDRANFADGDTMLIVDGGGVGRNVPANILPQRVNVAYASETPVRENPGGVSTASKYELGGFGNKGTLLQFPSPANAANNSNAWIGAVYNGNYSFDLYFWAGKSGNISASPTDASKALILRDYGVGLCAADIERFSVTSSAILPTADNVYTIAHGGLRLATIYMGSSPIVTSDEREKAWRGGLSDAHFRAARRIIVEVGLYQWNDAVEEKGADGARLHIGPRAQAVARIMVEEGLEAPFEDGTVPHFRHAFLCYDRWDETPARPAVAEVRDEAGEIVTPAQPAIAAVPAGDRFGLRIDQLTLFLMAALLGGDTAA
ncbi:MAG: tail fiber domain-containing protein [Sphingomonadales bacterium]|nr:tail fiber domain-containing protein [Sphingomonadales bacterium]